MNLSPEVSVIIPVYNRAQLICETLQSIRDQVFQNWECYIIDDGSTDDTQKVIRNYIQDDDRFFLILRPESKMKGAASCRNLGLEYAKGTYIQFLDSDDLLSEDKLSEQVKLLQKENDFTIIISKWGIFDSEYELFKNFTVYDTFNYVPDFLNALIQSKGYLPQHSYLIPRNLIRLGGHWNENLSLNDDGEFMIRILTNCQKILFSPLSTVWYRKPTLNNLSRRFDSKTMQKAIYSWELIESQLMIAFGNDAKNYIGWSISRFFLNVRNFQPDLIFLNQVFFKDQILKEKKN